jgi:hypothetical protein
MLQTTHAAITKIKELLKEETKGANRPVIRLSMGVG